MTETGGDFGCCEYDGAPVAGTASEVAAIPYEKLLDAMVKLRIAQSE